jgi:hypothetical protein
MLDNIFDLRITIVLIKKNISVNSIRAWQCTDQIERLKKTCLTHPYIRGFIHDITYGKGQFSILTDNKDYLKYFYINQLPALFTDKSGRFLPDGVYFTHTLPLKDEEKHLIDTISNTLNFDYLIHIVKHEQDIQHTYTFLLHCHEHQLLFFVANYLIQLQRFIMIYERHAKMRLTLLSLIKITLYYPIAKGN